MDDRQQVGRERETESEHLTQFQKKGSYKLEVKTCLLQL